MINLALELCFTKYPSLREYPIYIDGSNVAYFRKNKFYGRPVLSDIINLINYLIEKLRFSKEKIYCICDPATKYYIDRPTEYRVLVKEGLIIDAPKSADEFILGFALKHDFCFIISNDRFRQYFTQLPSRGWLEERRISFMIIDDKVCLSPNINPEKIFCLNRIQESSELTTLDILNRMNKTEGKLELY